MDINSTIFQTMIFCRVEEQSTPDTHSSSSTNTIVYTATLTTILYTNDLRIVYIIYFMYFMCITVYHNRRYSSNFC